VNAILTFIVFYPFFFVFLSSKRYFPMVFKLKKVWAHFLIWPPLLFYTIERKSVLNKNQAYVFCPNHTSYLDIILIYIAIPIYFHTMGKAELLKVPLFRHFFKRMNIPVNRKSRIDSHRAFIRAGTDIDKGISISLFPEGTINNKGPILGRFKNGPFKLAIEKQVPIVPITFLDNWILLPDDYNNKKGHPGLARIIIHEPIETIGMSDHDLEKLKSKVFDVINEPLVKAHPNHDYPDEKD
jgi:1-acyl-sn-glycerol-3-phosphate acyltransferase